MNAGYSAVQTARLVAALRWACGRLSEIVGAWAAEAAAAAVGGAQTGGGDQPDRSGRESFDVHVSAAAAAVEMTVLSRRLAAHRDVLDGLQPDSERLASWRLAAPADPSLADALDEIAALQGPLERRGVAREVLVPQLLGAYEEIREHAAPHCDAALASAAGSLSHDLDRGRVGGAARADAASSSAPAAESRLLAAGGLVGSSVLRPDSWA